MLPIVVALLAAFAGVVLLGPVYIGLLQRLGFGKQIRSDGPESHFGKAGTPSWSSCFWPWRCGSRTSTP